MYDKKLKCWKSQPCDESTLLWCREPFNKDNPEALFLLADHLLEKAERGKETADAVYMMERAAKAENPQAALAMGQMFQHGWAVHRSRKKALVWYTEAARLGSEEAGELLLAMRKARKKQFLLLACCIAGLTGAGLLLLFLHSPGPKGVVVHKDTELITPVSLEEFNEALSTLISEYDDELVISGQRSSNRLLLAFEGDGIDLSRFPAAAVIASQDNYVVIQFKSEEEAQRCLESLKENPAVAFVNEDGYSFGISTGLLPEQTSSGVPYHSSLTGKTYHTWGAEFLGMDHLADWLSGQKTEPVVVAVLDSGSAPCDSTEGRILPGMDVLQPGSNGWNDGNGHGTHVASTILDLTQGMDISVLPVRVILSNGKTADSFVIQGLQLAIQAGVDVINMSLGGPCITPSPPGQNCGNGVDHYIHQAVEQGIVVVTAAGNSTEDTENNCPAHIQECIVVAACDNQGNAADFSNYGLSVDLCAPGVEIVSHVPGGKLVSMDGTSMASPHIAALAAMMKTYLPDKTPAQIEKYITDYCVDMGAPEKYGEGIPWAGYLSGN